VAHDYVVPALLGAANARLVALCDRDPAALARVAALAPGARATAALDACLATPGVDAVYVATPNASHPAIVAAAARAGHAVLCEKPLARTAAEAEAMVQACAAAGVPYATAFDQRFHAAHRRLRALVAAGTLGTVTCVRIHYACWTPPDWRPAAWAHDNWRADPAVAGGGAMLDLAPHGLDLVQTLLDEPVVRVSCLLQRRVHPYPVDDGAVIAARTASGVLVSHTVAYNRPDAFPRRELEVIGTQARALATDTMGQTPGGRLTLTDVAGEVRDVSFAADDRSPFLAQVEAFGAALLDGRPFPFPPDRDLHTMRLLDACASERSADVPFAGAWRPRPADGTPDGAPEGATPHPSAAVPTLSPAADAAAFLRV
jgi:predicted dehydrogenase